MSLPPSLRRRACARGAAAGTARSARTAAPRTATLFSGLLATAALALVAPPLHAQSTLVVEGRAGIALPSGERPDGWAAGEAGAATDVHFALRRGEHVYIYVGFSQLRTPCEGTGCRGTRTSTQWNGGVRLDLRTTGIVPWLRLGAVSPSIERIPIASEGDAPAWGLSERGWGGEVGGGVRLPIGDRVGVSPGIRYIVARVGDHSPAPVTLRWVVADIGLVVGF